MIAQGISHTTVIPILKIKGKVTLPPMSVSVVGVKMPEVLDINNLYELNLIHSSYWKESFPWTFYAG